MTSLFRRRLLVLAVVALVGCRTGRNYPGTDGPRYSGGPPDIATGERAEITALRVASFNIEYALRMDAAMALIAAHAELRDADVLLLQEMDEAGTRRVAEGLGMSYVYYPGTYRLRTRRDFGNAILSRWPIVGDAKILLPHKGVLGGTQRLATAATLRVGGTEVRVYSVHLGTMINATAGGRRAQLRTILDDAKGYPRVILGGDMNSHGVGREARDAGYLWPTERGPKTTRFGRWDHIFLKGFESPASGSAGTVLDVKGSSDHRPVWAVALFPPPQGP